jgi:outer membrane autotransporter protein
VRAIGNVVGGSGSGGVVRNGVTSTGLTIEANNVTGGDVGVLASNEGLGATHIEASGLVAGGNSGILGSNGTNATDLTILAVDATGGQRGILAINQGFGATSVTSTGRAVSTAVGGVGILVVNDANATDLTVNANNVAGWDGLFARNLGTGATIVTATGDVVGTDGNFGVLVNNAASATDLTVNVANVSHNRLQAMSIVNEGTGATNVTATGNVIGGGGAGIFVRNGATATDLRINAVNVTGRSDGILARNEGTGATAITVTGNIVGTDGDGISVSSGVNTTGLTIEASHVSGQDYGFLANSASTGNTTITATGAVSGAVAGIAAYNFAQARDLKIEAATVNGGIDAVNGGVGTTSVTATGMVTGAVGLTPSAIRATSNSQPIDIVLSGAATGARNSSGLASDLAVTAIGGPVSLTNEGRMIGGVSFSGAFADRVVNTGVWSVAGTSDFGTGVDTVLSDPSGTLRVSGRVQFDNLENFVSRGLVTMQNGAAGDRFVTPANISLAPGSRLAIDINAAGVADGIQTSGVANITNAMLDVSVRGVRIGRYTVVTADAGLIGTFGSVTGIGPISAFAGIVDSYDATNAYLDVLQVRDFADAGLTRNQKAAAAGAQSLSGGDSFFAGNPLYNAILALPTDAAAQNAFDQISSEIHASAQTALIEDSHFVRDAATNRIRAAFGAVGASRAPVMAYADPADGKTGAYAAFASLDPRTTAAIAAAPTTDRFAIWGQGFGSWGHTNGDGNAARLNRSTGGFLIGGDAPIFDTWRLGMMAGYSRTNFNVRDRASSGSSDNYHLGLYGGTQWGSLGFGTGAAYTWHDIATSRSIAFSGFSDSLKGDYRAGTAQVFGELGYDIRAGSFGFEPFANLAYVNFSTDGFAEQGGAAALRNISNSTGVAFTTLGVHVSTDVDLGPMTATLRSTVGWRHAFGDTTPLSTFAGGSPFTVAGVPIARDAFVLDAGLDVAVARNATLGVSYGGQFGGSAIDQSIRANFNVKF